ncbi:MAG: DUF808 family protein [Hyphomicrobiaceae bacterium]
MVLGLLGPLDDVAALARLAPASPDRIASRAAQADAMAAGIVIDSASSGHDI